MLLNTRVPFGTTLPKLPQPKGHAAAPAVLATGKPVVGDMFPGPIAKETLVAVVVPVIRGGTRFLLLSTNETRQFQRLIDDVSLPPGWTLTLLDGKSEVMARRAAAEIEGGPGGEEMPRRFVANSAVAPWSVVLEIPRSVYRAPIVSAAVAFAVAILAVTLISILAGSQAGRRLARSVATLTATRSSESPRPVIAEIEEIRGILADAGAAREAADSARQGSEELFSATFEQAAVGIAHVAPDGRWLRVNQKLCDIVGYPCEELLVKTFQDITHPEDLEADLGYVRQVLADEIKTYSLVKRYFRKDGSIVWINLTVSLVRNDLGQPKYFISVVEDITDRKWAEEALSASEERFFTIFKAAPGAMILSSQPDGKTVEVNDNFSLITGYSREESLGKTTGELGMWSDPNMRDRFLSLLQSDGVVRDLEADLKHKSGAIRNGLVSGHVLTIRGRKYLLGVFYDITERKRAEGTTIQRLREITALDALAQQIAAHISLDRVVDASFAGISEIVPSDLTLFFMRNGEELELLRSGPSDSSYKHEATPVHCLGECLCGIAARTGRPVYSDDIHVDPRCTWEECKRAGLRSFAALPLLSETKVLGVFCLASGGEVDYEKRGAFLEAYSGEIALGLKNALLIEELRKRTAELEKEIAERTLVAAELLQQRGLLSTILESATEAIFAKDTTGRYLAINETGARMLGFVAPDVLGRTDMELLPAETAGDFRKTDELVMSGGQAYEREEIGVIESRTRIFHAHKTPWRDNSGKIIGIIGISSDITDRKQAENALRVSEANLRKAQEIAKMGSWLIDLADRTTSWSDEMYQIYGVSPETFTPNAESFIKLIHPDDRPAMGEWIRTYFAGEGPDALEFRGVLPDGTVRFFRAQGGVIADADGRPTHMAGTAQDITEHKRAESERERLAVAIEQAAETVMVTDAEGTIQYVNPMFETVTGYTRAEAVGQNPRLLKSGEHDEVFYRGLWETIAAGRVWEGRLVNRKKDGSLYTEDTTISPVRDAAGQIVSYVAVKRDVTEQLRFVEEKARLEDQLRQAQKVEAIGRLAGSVAHDFNNLTAIILGYGEMLLGRLRPEDPLRKYAEQIMQAGLRSAALTRQLLAFSRKQTLQPEVLDLNALLRNFETMLARLIREDIRLELKLAATLGRVTADPGQIEQVVTNLVLNARDAMAKGGILTVETADVELDQIYALGHESVVPGRYVMLAVTDTGCGMDKATMARVFEPFYTTKEKGKGTGLGLATAYGIIKQSGGYIWAYSEPDQGTTFKIYLPQTDAALATNVVDAGTEAPKGSGELILLVEDEAPLRELCETVLVRLGYRVNAAGNGRKALLLVQEQGLEPDLVITDVIMPVMSGTAMMERLRRDQPEIRVLYMSGYPDDTIVRHGVLELGTLFIQKPFTERALAVKVWEALEGKPVAALLGRRVLMIDDDEQFRELVQHFCTKHGHVFAGASDLATAITALAGQHFDVLLVDKNIPGTSGEHILREIRAAGHATPAIVLTGDVASADMDLLRPLGVIRALEKSSNAELLLQAIDEAQAPG